MSEKLPFTPLDNDKSVLVPRGGGDIDTWRVATEDGTSYVYGEEIEPGVRDYRIVRDDSALGLEIQGRLADILGKSRTSITAEQLERGSPPEISIETEPEVRQEIAEGMARSALNLAEVADPANIIEAQDLKPAVVEAPETEEVIDTLGSEELDDDNETEEPESGLLQEVELLKEATHRDLVQRARGLDDIITGTLSSVKVQANELEDTATGLYQAARYEDGSNGRAVMDAQDRLSQVSRIFGMVEQALIDAKDTTENQTALIATAQSSIISMAQRIQPRLEQGGDIQTENRSDTQQADEVVHNLRTSLILLQDQIDETNKQISSAARDLEDVKYRLSSVMNNLASFDTYSTSNVDIHEIARSVQSLTDGGEYEQLARAIKKLQGANDEASSTISYLNR